MLATSRLNGESTDAIGGQDVADDQQTVDYRKIAHVFGGLLLVVCGVLWSVWATSHSDKDDANQRLNLEQSQYIDKNRGKIRDLEYANGSNEKRLDDLEARVRNLEWPDKHRSK